MWKSLPRAARVYLTAVAGLSLAGLAFVVTVAATGTPLLAASPSPSPSAGTGTNYCSRFTGHVASNLGKSQSQVQKAISDAIGQTIDDAVKNGDLTQSQANAMKSRLSGNSNQACAGGIKGLPGIGRGGFDGPGDLGRHGPVDLLNEIARALGISTSELQQDLKSGQTVQQIASAKGMDEAAFRSKLSSVTRTDLDQQVKAGNLTQNQENSILQAIQNGPLPLWSGTGHRRLGPRPTPTSTP